MECPLEGFQILPFLKTFVTDFLEPKKTRKLKVSINMDNDWMYCVYQNRGKGSRTLGVMSLGRFSFPTHVFFSSDGTVAGLQSDPLTALV